METDDYSVVDDRETGTRTETITLEKVFADELTVIIFYDPCWLFALLSSGCNFTSNDQIYDLFAYIRLRFQTNWP